MQHPATLDRIGLRSFMDLKPANVRRMRDKDRITCGCSRHENMRLAITGFNTSSARIHENNQCPEGAECKQRGKIPGSVHEFVEKFSCARPAGQAHANPECVDGTCLTCGGGLSVPLCAKERQTNGGLQVRFKQLLFSIVNEYSEKPGYCT